MDLMGFRRHDNSSSRVEKLRPGGCCDVGYPLEAHLKFKFRDISIVRNIYFICKSFWKFA